MKTGITRTTCAVSIVLSMSAFASDLPTKTLAYKTPIVVPPYN